MPIRLVLADDHPIVLRGLERLFELERDFQVVASCLTADETLQAVQRHRPDVLILDIRMPEKDSLALARELHEAKWPTRVVILTAALDEDQVIEALRHGVRGVVLKEMAPQLLVQCVRKVHAGGQWIEQRSFGQVLEKVLRREAGARHFAGLTARELEVVRMVAVGRRNKEIAERLAIGEGTVKVHLHNIEVRRPGPDRRVEIDSRIGRRPVGRYGHRSKLPGAGPTQRSRGGGRSAAVPASGRRHTLGIGGETIRGSAASPEPVPALRCLPGPLTRRSAGRRSASRSGFPSGRRRASASPAR